MRYATILSAKLEIGTTHREIRICPAADRCQGTREWPQRRPSGRIIVANDRKIALKTQDLSPLMKSLISKILRRLLGCHQGDLLDDARRRRLLRYKRQLEMVDDPVHGGIIHDESDDFHRATAFGANHRIDLVDFPDHRRPALGWDALLFPLCHPEGEGRDPRFPHLSPVGIGIKPIVTNHDLPLVGNMRGHPNDELQIIHRFQTGRVLAISVTDLALGLYKRELLQGQYCPDHVLPHAFGFTFGLGPYPAVDRKSRMPPGQQPLGIAGGTEPPGLAGKRQKMLSPAARTTNPGDRFGLSSWKNIHRSMRANPHRGLPQSRYFSTTSLTIGRK